MGALGIFPNLNPQAKEAILGPSRIELGTIFLSR